MQDTGNRCFLWRYPETQSYVRAASKWHDTSLCAAQPSVQPRNVQPSVSRSSALPSSVFHGRPISKPDAVHRQSRRTAINTPLGDHVGAVLANMHVIYGRKRNDYPKPVYISLYGRCHFSTALGVDV